MSGTTNNTCSRSAPLRPARVAQVAPILWEQPGAALGVAVQLEEEARLLARAALRKALTGSPTGRKSAVVRHVLYSLGRVAWPSGWPSDGLGRTLTRGELNSKCGAEGQNRTGDTRIFSPLLYQLSYLGSRERVLGQRSEKRSPLVYRECEGVPTGSQHWPPLSRSDRILPVADRCHGCAQEVRHDSLGRSAPPTRRHRGPGSCRCR